MMVRAATRQLNRLAIVDLSGDMRLGAGIAVLRNAVWNLTNKGHKRIILNVRDVTNVDCSGFGELVTVYKSVRGQGGEVKLMNLPKRLRQLLQITRLSTVFDIVEDEVYVSAAFSASQCLAFRTPIAASRLSNGGRLSSPLRRKAMKRIALHMLMGETGKYLGIVAGVMFASLLIIQQMAMLFGILRQTYSGISAVHADIWVMDPRVKSIDDSPTTSYTPTGTYTVTIVGTDTSSSSITATTTMTLTVD